jgi:hypothetical protein
MQVLQLPLGIVEGIAQGHIDVIVCCAIGMKTVGVDLCTRHAQVNIHEIRSPCAAMAIRACERYVALRNPLAEALQPGL